MTTYSTSLKLALIGDGEQSGIWGQTTNTNLGTLLEQAITGVQSIVMSDANYTLSNLNGASDEARNAVLVVTGTNSAVRDLIPPVVKKTYTVFNNTTGGYAIRVIGSTGTGVTIPNGTTALVYCNGTNFYSGLSGTLGNFNVAGDLSVTGNETVTGTLGVTGALSGTTASFSGAISSVSPAFTGTPTAPTASPGTNTTQIATTAFVNAAIVPAGGIIMWSGSIASIPSGWYLCDGNNGTPNLLDKFIVAAGNTYAVAATGGSADSVVVSHTHTIIDPGHTHVTDPATAYVGTSAGGHPGGGAPNPDGNSVLSLTSASTGITINSTGVSGTNKNLPPYYALAYIMKA